VTSRVGAAWRDVVAVAHRRGGGRIVLSAALVQGEAAVESLIAAIDRIERYPGLDVLIVGRGGGAGEDLMAFNDERLVRRLAVVAVPVVSAVGHDIDTTLADLVADQRAATPSEAAELVVPDSQERKGELERAVLGMARAIEHRMADDRATSAVLSARLSDPRFAIAFQQQSLDELTGRLQRAVQHQLRHARIPLDRHRRLLLTRHPRVVIASSRARVVSLAMSLQAQHSLVLHTARMQLGSAAARLDALSPLAVLGRGYSIATRLDGRAIRGPDEIAVGERFHVRLARGGLLAEVRGKPGSMRNEVDE
jgi:exodeoxyribonuclease VII large subunit